MYYEDKSTAIRYYKKFLDLAEDENSQQLLIDYTRDRLNELKEMEFFRGGK